MIKESYNQYESYTDVVYKLVGYDISCPEYETYPRFSIHPAEESIYHTLEHVEAKIKETLQKGIKVTYTDILYLRRVTKIAFAGIYNKKHITI